MLDSYPHLNLRMQLWPGGWVKKMENINEAVGEKNCLDKYGRKKLLFRHFTRNELWKCIG